MSPDLPSTRLGELRGGLTVLLVAMVGLACGTAGALYSFSFFVEPLMAAHGASRTQVTSWVTMYTATLLLTAPLVGRLTDLYGARPVATTSFVGLAIAYVYAAYAPAGIVTLYVSAFLIAALGGGTLPITLTKVIVSQFRLMRGLALGLALCGALAGVTVASHLLPGAIDSGGVRTGYLTLAGMALFALPIVGLGLREPANVCPEMRSTIQGLTLRESSQTTVFWLLAASFLTFCLASTGVVVHFVAAMGERHVTPAETTKYFAALSAGSLVGRLAIGALVDRVFAPKLIFLLFGVTAVACFSIAAADIRYVIIAVIVLGFAIGAEVDLISFLTASYFGMKCYGQIYGVLYALFAAGSALGPPLVSVIRESSGGYVSAYAICGLFMLISAVLFLWIARHPFLAGEART